MKEAHPTAAQLGGRPRSSVAGRCDKAAERWSPTRCSVKRGRVPVINLATLRGSAQVVDDLAWPYDFDLNRASDDSSWIALRPSMNFHVLAGDGTGGVFLAYGEDAPEQLPVLHATSEGQAGKIARSLHEAIALHIQVPYWRDVLKFSGNGDLAQMRRAAPFLEAEYSEDMPELSEAKGRLLAVLNVMMLDDPIGYLHDCVHATDCTLVADDGCVWESLFNKFTIDQNRSWQQWAAQQGDAEDGPDGRPLIDVGSL